MPIFVCEIEKGSFHEIHMQLRSTQCVCVGTKALQHKYFPNSISADYVVDVGLPLLEKDLKNENSCLDPCWSAYIPTQDQGLVNGCQSLTDGVRTAKITTLRGLKRKLTKVWNELSWDYVRRSVDSIPARLNECIALQGERIHY